MKTITELNDQNFDQTIAGAGTPVVVDFYAPWCGPCKMLAPLLEQLAEKFAGRLQYFKVNVDEAPGLAGRFEITGVPTLLLFRKGEVQEAIVGFASPRELVTKFEELAAGVAEVRA